MTFPTWSTTDINGVALSGGNLTATFTGLIGGGVRSTYGQSIGKYYFELTVSAWADASTQVGVSQAGVGLGGIASGGSGTITLPRSGTVWVNGASTLTNIGARATGDTIGVAIDLTNQLIWFRVAPSGNWNGNAAYAPNGSGGISTVGLFGAGTAAFPVAAFYSAADVVVANFGASAFLGTPPSGYFVGGFTIFNPADKNNTTLSNGNLTATSGSTGAVRTLDRLDSRYIKDTGISKFYWEYNCTNWGQSATRVGIATSDCDLTQVVSGRVNYHVTLLQDGGFWAGWQQLTGYSWPTISTGANIGIAVDLMAGKVWFRLNGGNWNTISTENPATGAGGVNMNQVTALGPNASAPLSAIYGIAGFWSGGDITTANFGASPFAYPVPSGYFAGFPSPAGTLSAGTTIDAVEQWGGVGAAQVSQIAVEQWASLSVTSGQAQVTQIAVEEWASVAAGRQLQRATVLV